MLPATAIPTGGWCLGARIAKAEQASANRFHHTIKLSGVNNIDKELLRWMKEAYVLKNNFYKFLLLTKESFICQL